MPLSLMEIFENCNTSTLAPYVPSAEKPWNIERIHHLYRRLGFSASVPTINAGISRNPGELVDEIIDEAINLPITTAPEWADWTGINYPQENDLRNELLNTQRREWALTYAEAILNDALRDRLSFFWSNHFVTELNVYNLPTFCIQYTHSLQTHSLGNFKEFVREIGITNAMLRYLDGNRNRKNRPNENYARELFELFSLGEGNGYTEEDIVETSRALTGYVRTVIPEDYFSGFMFEPTQFDTGTKTVFGQTGAWGYDDIIEILFTERQNEIATFICEKLYKYFVHPDAPEAIINEMAATFIAANWEIAPVLRQLFKSEHFFDSNSIGVIIKSPYDVIFDFINETSFQYDQQILESVIYFNGLIGQNLFNPVDVAGWQRNRNWISANALIGRWSIMEWFIFYNWNIDQEQFRTFAIDLAGDSTDPYYITREIVDAVVPRGLLTDDDYQIASDIFKSDIPDFYYEDNTWNLYWESAPYQVLLLLLHVVKEPEFQLK